MDIGITELIQMWLPIQLYSAVLYTTLLFIAILLPGSIKSKLVLILFIIFLQVEKVYPLSIYEFGICTPNDIFSMHKFVVTLYILNQFKIKYEDLRKYEKITRVKEVMNHFSSVTYNNKKILKLPEKIRCDFYPEREYEPLTNITFQLNGYNFIHNRPIKLHHCTINEIESVYRQILCAITFDISIMNEFITFSHKYIDRMFKDFILTKGFKELSLDDYFVKLGSKKKEYIDGYLDYLNNLPLKLIFKMHTKTDEKIFINPEEPKSKARNICAQLPMSKVLMGLVCELGMQCLHSQEWCGPGYSLKEKSEKFSNWSQELGPKMCSLCVDGSSFDSTQHEILLEQIDSYYLRRVIQLNSYLTDIYNITDVIRVCNQTKFTIYSKKGVLYKINGTQMSGRMNTCLSNTLRSALYIEFIIYKSGILRVNIKFEVTGDDQIIFGYESSLLIYMNCAYKYVYSKIDGPISHGLGQICKIMEFNREVTGSEYLSNYVLRHDDLDICLIRKPERFFQLIPFTFRNNFKNKLKFELCKHSLAFDVALSQLLNFNNIEIFNCFLLKMKDIALDNLNKLNQQNKIPWRIRASVNKIIENNRYKTRYQHNENVHQKFNKVLNELLYNKYTINNNDIEEFKKLISEINDSNGDIRCHFIDKLYRVNKDNEYSLNKKLYKLPHYIIDDFDSFEPILVTC
jgi:hypothetical protein